MFDYELVDDYLCASKIKVRDIIFNVSHFFMYVVLSLIYTIKKERKKQLEKTTLTIQNKNKNYNNRLTRYYYPTFLLIDSPFTYNVIN